MNVWDNTSSLITIVAVVRKHRCVERRGRTLLSSEIGVILSYGFIIATSHRIVASIFTRPEGQSAAIDSIGPVLFDDAMKSVRIQALSIPAAAVADSAQGCISRKDKRGTENFGCCHAQNSSFGTVTMAAPKSIVALFVVLHCPLADPFSPCRSNSMRNPGACCVLQPKDAKHLP